MVAKDPTANYKLMYSMVETLLPKYVALLEKASTATGKAAENLKSQAGSVSSSPSGGGAGGGGNRPGEFHEPPRNSFSIGEFAKTAALTGATMATQMVDTSQFIQNDMLRRRVGFFGAGGPNNASNKFLEMMRGGTANSTMDAAQAGALGLNYGFAPGSSSNWNTISRSAMSVSNLLPGAGLEVGMQASLAANQASSVNKLRMIGIQVRNSRGDFMGIPSIVNQLWDIMSRTSGGKITKQQIMYSLQSGNALASLLDQYFGNDEYLRQAVVTGLLAKAVGADVNSQKSLIEHGITPPIAKSTGTRNTSQYNLLNKNTTAGVQGVIDANGAVTNTADALAGPLNGFSNAVSKFVASIDTFAGAGGGAGGTFMAGMASMIGSALGPSLAKLGPIMSSAIGPAIAGLEVTLGSALLPLAAIAAAIAVPLGVGEAYSKVDARTSKGKKSINATIARVQKNTGSKFFDQTDYLTGGGTGKSSALNNMDMSMSGGNNGIGGAFYGLGVGDIGGNMSAVGTADYASNPLAPNKLSTPPNGEFGNFASFRRQKHRGQDFVAKTGTSIKAVRSGKVIKAGLEGDLGSMIRIQHPDGMRTVYGHLSSATVQEGTNVYGGQEIGLAGYSGGVYPKGPAGAHLHLALEDHSGQVHDPMPYLAGASNSVVNLGNNMSTASGVAASPASTSGVSMFGHLTGASMFSSGVGDSSGGPSYPSAGVNYGGVTVHINVPSGAAINETTLANEIKRVLRDEEQLKMAVSR